MSKKTFITQVLVSGSLDDRHIIISEALTKQAAIQLNQPLLLQCGGVQTEVIVQTNRRVNGIVIGRTLSLRCGIPHNAKVRIDYRANNTTLRIGPVLGVLMSRVYRQNPEKPFGSNTGFCEELTAAGKIQGGIVFFFTPESLSSKTTSLQGWYWHGRWRRRQFPVPNVIYNRLTSRRLENKPSVQQFFNHAKSRYNTSIFNEKFLDKTDVFSALQQDPTLHPFLPESHALKNYRMLQNMMRKYRTIFLKPARGSLGKGIIRITKLNRGFTLETNSMSGIKTRRFKSLPLVFRSISGKLKASRYQIQQGLSLMQVNGRPVDFRALVQKNISGNWEITSIVARIAGNKHFVSNLARGGSLSSVQVAIRQSVLPNTTKKKLPQRLKHAALQLAKGIEQNMPYHYGELGVDLAVDQVGKVWLIEINSKPSKNDNTSLATGRIRPSVRKVLHYCRFLSEF